MLRSHFSRHSGWSRIVGRILGFGIVFSALHGFRMPLFFVMSGFFSAMLLHRRGRGSLVKHRFHRVFLPMLLGMVTIVPATNWISGIAISSASSKPGGASPTGKASSIWAAARAGDLGAIERQIASGVSVNDVDPDRGGTPLLWAAVTGRAEAIELLIGRGADLNAVDRDGCDGPARRSLSGPRESCRCIGPKRREDQRDEQEGRDAVR